MKNKFVVVVLVIVVASAGLLLLNASRTPRLSNVNQLDSETSNISASENSQYISQTGTPQTSSFEKYIDYSPAFYGENADKKRVLFFHASWCPTCIAANKDILKNADQIPEDVVILKTDYDTETTLKKKYNITYQHTFVQVDAEGNEIAKWNGGGVEEILSRLN